MAYLGSTAASSVANPPRRMVDPIVSAVAESSVTVAAPAAPGGQGGGLWYYCSTHTSGDVGGAGFFTDAKDLGMRPGDLLLTVVLASSNVRALIGVVASVTSTGAAVSLTT